LKKDNENLTTRQKELLSDISLKANGNTEIAEGVKFLSENLPTKGDLQEIQNLLKTIGYSSLEAERASLILADKQTQKINNQLKNQNLASLNNSKNVHSYPKMQKIVSPDTVKNLLLTGKLKHDEARALMQYSRLMGGETTIRAGLKKILNVLNNKDLPIKDFERVLKSANLHEKHIATLSKLLMTMKNPEIQSEELVLVKDLEKQDKLPAIFFKFSKKQCDNLLKSYLKTGESLLSDDEKARAATIIEKHIQKGGFLGTNFKPENLLSGVAVHHAGKMPAYKALVEELSENKLLKVVFATSTLGAGINVPAKTVVFTQLTRYNGNQANTPDEKFVPLTIAEFQQMAGRAGRRGKDFVGNVVVMLDKKHSSEDVFKLATSAPDEIKSNFKPTYSLITHFISQDGSAENLGDAVEKSFLQDSLKNSNVKPYKVFNKMKKEFDSMAKVVLSPELGIFETEDGKLLPTPKGKVVAKARGVNGLLFAEILFNGGLEYLTPEELATIACTLTPPDERDKADLPAFSEMTLNTLICLNSLYNKINQIEYNQKVDFNPLCLNLADAQHISKWASVSSQDTRQEWENLIKEISKVNPNFTEGDFLKSINSTVDILEQIKETSRYVLDETSDKSSNLAKKMSKINNISKEALSLLKRDPIEYDL
jgi:superfamily II RNA helicase